MLVGVGTTVAVAVGFGVSAGVSLTGSISEQPESASSVSVTKVVPHLVFLIFPPLRK